VILLKVNSDMIHLFALHLAAYFSTQKEESSNQTLPYFVHAGCNAPLLGAIRHLGISCEAHGERKRPLMLQLRVRICGRAVPVQICYRNKENCSFLIFAVALTFGHHQALQKLNWNQLLIRRAEH